MSATAVRNAPSVSPLSTASKTKESSPANSRDVMMDNAISDDEPVGAADALDATAADVADLADDRSSSLSEPDDDDDVDNQLANDDEMDDDGDLESSVQLSVDVDSEAETERVEQTPTKQRKLASNLGRTPSKLSRSANADDELSDPSSPVPAGAGAASSTSTLDNAGKKRKRSHTAESSLTSADSDIGESPPKRAHTSSVSANGREDDVGETGPADHDADADAHEPSRVASITHGKVGRGRKGKAKGRRAKAITEEPETEQTDEALDVEEDVSEESNVRSEEEIRQRKEASQLFEDLAKQFRAFREKLTNERLASLTAELDLLAQPACEHPEYLRQVACIDARLYKQRAEVQALYNYRMRSLRQRTLGERSQLHSQYFQGVRQLREDSLDQLGKDWYAIQKERRQIHQGGDQAYMSRLPAKRSLQIQDQAKYNLEVSILSGVAKYVGFPAAPEMKGVDGTELESDLRAMNILKPAVEPPQPTQSTFISKPAVSHTLSGNEKLAHDQFLEQNAWARPQGPVQTHNVLGISHTPDWAEPNVYNSAKGIIRNFDSRSPLATPVPQRRVPVEHSSSGTVVLNSDGIDPPSSVIAAPPTIDRVSQFHHNHDASPLILHKHRQPPNGHDREEIPPLRSISNLPVPNINDNNTLTSTPAAFPGPPPQPDTRPSPFDSSHMHSIRHDEKHLHGSKREMYASVSGFRPQEASSYTKSAPAATPLPSASSTSA